VEMALAWPFVSAPPVSTGASASFRDATETQPGLNAGARPIVPAVNQATTISCPKCGGEMRAYERNGVVVDQCTECRGIFLDRGELERLVDAEGRHYGDSGERPRENDRRDERRHEDDRRPKKSKKRSFLENLFEGE
jgi:uncharacterized protein